MRASQATQDRAAALLVDATNVAQGLNPRMTQKGVKQLAVSARSLARHATALACLLEKAIGEGRKESHE